MNIFARLRKRQEDKLRAAIREGVQEGFKPLEDFAKQLSDFYGRVHELHTKLKEQREMRQKEEPKK